MDVDLSYGRLMSVRESRTEDHHTEDTDLAFREQKLHTFASLGMCNRIVFALFIVAQCIEAAGWRGRSRRGTTTGSGLGHGDGPAVPRWGRCAGQKSAIALGERSWTERRTGQIIEPGWVEVKAKSRSRSHLRHVHVSSERLDDDVPRHADLAMFALRLEG